MAADEASENGDATREVWATYYVAVINTVLRRPLEALEAAAKALVDARETGNPTALAFSLYAKGLVGKHRSPAEAIAMFEEAVRMADSVRNDRFGGIARMELTSTNATHGDRREGLQDFAGVVDHWHRAGADTQLRHMALSGQQTGRRIGSTMGPQFSQAPWSPEPARLSHSLIQNAGRPNGRAGEAEYRRLTVRGSVMSAHELVVASLAATERPQWVTSPSEVFEPNFDPGPFRLLLILL